METGEFGKLMKWGSGDADALAQIPKLAREGLARDGVTREMAESWANWYRNEALANPGNPSASGRAVLMDAAARLLR